ncbi:hypothetical protein DL769_004013 [Monosporascus sp. CRB-8-3]|nr:hypothetical protein DL769_004013 [Monosporascus sp. CRB-8-3]
MGRLFNTSKAALEKRKQDPDARFDIVAHWLRTHEQTPEALSFRDIEAQAAVSVAAGSDTLSSATIVRSYSIRQVDLKKEWEWKAYFTVVPHSWPVYIEKQDI